LLLESTLKKELVIENVRAICWIVPKKYLLLLDQTILLNVHKIAIFSDELENVKQLNFSLQKFESDNIEFEKKSVLVYIIVISENSFPLFAVPTFLFIDFT
jgi:hypothetical protein